MKHTMSASCSMAPDSRRSLSWGRLLSAGVGRHGCGVIACAAQMGPPPQTNAVFAVGRGGRTERVSRAAVRRGEGCAVSDHNGAPAANQRSVCGGGRRQNGTSEPCRGAARRGMCSLCRRRGRLCPPCTPTPRAHTVRIPTTSLRWSRNDRRGKRFLLPSLRGFRRSAASGG